MTDDKVIKLDFKKKICKKEDTDEAGEPRCIVEVFVKEGLVGVSLVENPIMLHPATAFDFALVLMSAIRAAYMTNKKE